MGKGGYLGGSTVIRVNPTKMSVKSGAKLTKKEKAARQKAPGLHVLSEDDQERIRKKVAESRKLSAEQAKSKQHAEALRRQNAKNDFERYFADGTEKKVLQTAKGTVVVERRAKKRQ